MRSNKTIQLAIFLFIITSMINPTAVMSATTKPLWCWEGGSKHVISEGIGWYDSYDEAWKAALKYEGTNQEVQECDCGKFTAYVTTNTTTHTHSYKTITLSATSYTYDGKVKKPSVTVKDSKGNKISSKNYTVIYSKGRKNVGKYTVTIKFKGNYSGTVKKTFTIKPKKTSISKLTAGKKKLTIKWKKQTTQTTGYQIQYSTSSNFKNAKTVTVSKNKTTSKTISKLKANKKYYVRIRTYKTVNGTKYYSSWSGYKTVKTKK